MSTLRTDVLKDVAETVTVNIVDIPAGLAAAGVLRQDLADNANPAKGAALVGYSGGTVAAKLTSLESQLGNIVTPFQFGVTNNGTTDYTQNLRDMHDFANLNGKQVNYSGITTCSIQANAQIIINTSTDFAGCKFSVLGGIVGTPVFSPINTLFVIQDVSLTPVAVTLNTAELFRGAHRVTVPETVGHGMLHITSNKSIGTRLGDPTVLFYEQTFEMDRGGVFTLPLGTDLTTSTVAATFYPSPSSWIEIKGISAKESTYNNQCLVRIKRNFVTVSNVTTIPGGLNTAPVSINYLVAFNYCCAVKFKDSHITAQSTVGGASYGIDLSFVASATFENLAGNGRNTWGVMGSNNVNGLYVTDCKLNRIDCHSGLHNLTVRSSVVGEESIQYGWGTGVIDIDGVYVSQPASLLKTRQDFFGGFDGKISVSNITVNLANVTIGGSGYYAAPPLVSLDALGGTNVLADIKAVDSVSIRNVEYKYDGATDTLVITPLKMTRAGATTLVRFPSSVEVKSVKASRGRPGIYFDFKLYDFQNPTTGRVNIIVADMVSTPRGTLPTFYDAGAAVSAYTGSPVLLTQRIDNFIGYTQHTVTPNALIDISNSSISAIYNFGGTSSAQQIYIKGCKLVDPVVLGSAPLGNIGSGGPVDILGLLVEGNTSMLSARSLQGVLVRVGVTAALPVGSTIATAHTGWHDTTYQ